MEVALTIPTLSQMADKRFINIALIQLTKITRENENPGLIAPAARYAAACNPEIMVYLYCENLHKIRVLLVRQYNVDITLN